MLAIFSCKVVDAKQHARKVTTVTKGCVRDVTWVVRLVVDQGRMNVCHVRLVGNFSLGHVVPIVRKVTTRQWMVVSGAIIRARTVQVPNLLNYEMLFVLMKECLRFDLQDVKIKMIKGELTLKRCCFPHNQFQLFK